MWSFWLSSVNLWIWFLLRLLWYNLIPRSHWGYFWSFNLLGWDWLMLHRSLNIILNLTNFFLRDYRYIIISLLDLRNFRLSLNFKCRRGWRLLCPNFHKQDALVSWPLEEWPLLWNLHQVGHVKYTNTLYTFVLLIYMFSTKSHYLYYWVISSIYKLKNNFLKINFLKSILN